MPPVYPTSQRIYAYLNDVRTDISANVHGNIIMNDLGMTGNGPLDRLGAASQLKFVLNNPTGIYTPGSLTALSGWDEGIAVELALVYESNTYLYRFYVESIKPPTKYQDIYTQVTAVSWMKYAMEHPIENPGALIDKRGNDVLNETLALMPIQPQNLDFDEGINVFPVAFDVITSTTKAYDEMVKVAMSEIGYVYLIHDRQYGETLRFENARSRTGLRALSSVPVSQASSGYLLKPGSTDFIRTPSNDKIILNQVSDAVIDNTIMDITAEYGTDVINHFTAWANPRRVDTSFVILFQLDRAIALGSGPEIEIKGTYADPAGGAQISGQDIIDPVITTDYLVNSAEDGSGTNISTSLTFTYSQFGTEGFTVRVKNTDPDFNGWLTKFNVRGHGVYNYNPISIVARNQTSINQRGTKTAALTQKYKDNFYESGIFVRAEVDRNKNPRIILNAISMCANYSAALMTAFLNLHPGDLVNVDIDKYNIDGHYYIQGVDNVSISTGGIINFDWILRESLSLQSGLSPIAVEFGASGNTDAIDFGYLAPVSNLDQVTYAAWVYPTSAVAIIVMGHSSDAGADWVSVENAGTRVRLLSKHTGGQGWWDTTNNVIALNEWHHIVITYDVSTNNLAAPLIYVDGASVSVTEMNAPADAPKEDQTGGNWMIGNTNTPSQPYDQSFFGKLKDLRVYNRILTAAEVTTLYNSGVVNSSLVTDGLVFQGLNVRTSEYADFVDATLTIDQRPIDNILGAVGTPRGAPIGRAP